MICSVAMSTYNGEKFLAKQLDSIVNQTRPVDEIVINDDCSTDKTLEIIASYQKAHPEIHWIILTSKSNQGWRQGFHRASAHCNGDLVFFCDQDDIWLPNKIADLEQILAERPEILVLFSDHKIIDANDNLLPLNSSHGNINVTNRVMYHPDQIVKVSLSERLGRPQCQGCTMAIRKSIINQYLSSSFILAHDGLVSTLAAIQGGLYFYKMPLIHYRLHGANAIGTITGASRKTSILKNLRIFLSSVKYILIKNDGKKYREEILNCDVDWKDPLFDLVTPPSAEKLEYEVWKHFMRKRIQLVKNRKLLHFLFFFLSNKNYYLEMAMFSTYEHYISRFMMDLCALIKG